MHNRHVYRATLTPLLGSTFQPTGFPDLGAGRLSRWDNTKNGFVDGLLVESIQSMANRLEATAWDDATHSQTDAVTGLPYIDVVDAAGEWKTSSRLEAHRLTSAFVRDSTLEGQSMVDVIRERLGLAKDTPLDYRRIAAAVVAMDPLSLLHGVFFNQKAWIGQPRITRAISAVIEAHNVVPALSGGLKNDHVRRGSGDGDKDPETGGATEGYGPVPFARMEWTAERIEATVIIDTALLASYGLPEPVTDMLTTLAHWEIRSLLSGGLRLRTNCDLDTVGDIQTLKGEPLPELEALTPRLRELIDKSQPHLGSGGPVAVVWNGGKKTSKTKNA